jgi:hypothetical protein
MTVPTTPGTLTRARTWIAALAAFVALTLVALAPSASQAAGAKKPKCVETTHNAGNVTQTVYVENHCPRATISFVVHRTGPDSPCLHVAPGHVRSYKWANGLDYQGTSYGCD